MNDLKDFHQNWWDKKVILGVTWNYIILVLASVVLIMAYYYGFDWDRVFGLR